MFFTGGRTAKIENKNYLAGLSKPLMDLDKE